MKRKKLKYFIVSYLELSINLNGLKPRENNYREIDLLIYRNANKETDSKTHVINYGK